jgi:hypothetical protein
MHPRTPVTFVLSSLLASLALASFHCGGKVVVDGVADAEGASGQSGSSTMSGGACNGPSSGLPSAPCTPTVAACRSDASVCLAAVDNTGASTFGLRMADLTLTAPLPWTQGAFKDGIERSVVLDDNECNLNGAGTLSWLLQLDTVTGTLRTGAAQPQDGKDPAYTFLDGLFQQGSDASFHAQPITLTAPVNATCEFESTPGDLVIPVFLDKKGASSFILPLRQARFSGGQLSGDHNCIGQFNAAGLDSAMGCFSDDNHPAFLHGANISAFFSLEEAESVAVEPFGLTLCLLLSGDFMTYGDQKKPIQGCRRNEKGEIVFQGDWCAATDQPVTPTCSDAVRFGATFAASAVKIN